MVKNLIALAALFLFAPSLYAADSAPLYQPPIELTDKKEEEPQPKSSRTLFTVSSEELDQRESLERISGGQMDMGFASVDDTYQSNSTHAFKGPFSTDYTS